MLSKTCWHLELAKFVFQSSRPPHPNVMSSSSTTGTFKKQLLAMDFDHTISDTNTDVEVQDLAEDAHIPQDIKDLYSSECLSSFCLYIVFR